MFWCDKCKIWEHKTCLINAIRKEYIQMKSSKVGTNYWKSWHNNIRVELFTIKETGNVVANIHDDGLKINGEKTEHDLGFEGNVHGLVTTIAVKCLKCETSLS